MFRRLFPLLLLIFLILPCLAFDSSAQFNEEDKIVVVLDPGHGGGDPGSVGTKTEAYYNLQVANACAAALRENGNFIVKMTRTTMDEELTLAERGVYADTQNADLIVSMHFNSSSASYANGIEVYSSVLPRFDMSELSGMLASELASATGLNIRGCFERYDSGDHTGIYYWSEKYQWDIPDDPSVGGLSDHYGIITWAAKFGFPGIIIEHAYLSNFSDLFITDSEGMLETMGKADAKAIIDYYTSHSHVYDTFFTDDYPVSCFSAGKKSIHCSICNHRKSVTPIADSPDPDAHLWLEEDVVRPTCQRDGHANLYCRYTYNLVDKGCDQFEEHKKEIILPKLDHDYRIVFQQPLSHTQDGITKYECSMCGDTYTNTEKAVGHVYEFLDRAEPSCTEEGGDRYICTDCGDIKTDVEAALGHNNRTLSKTDPTCEEDGYIKYQCTVCEEITEEILESTGHSYEAEIISVLTCVTDGETVYKCSACNASYTDKVIAVGHKLSIISSTDGDCETDAVTVSRCEICEITFEEITKSPGHKWNEGTVVTPPGFFSKGEITFTCENNADHTKTEAISSTLVRFLRDHKIILLCIFAALVAALIFIIVFIAVRSKKAKIKALNESTQNTNNDSKEEDTKESTETINN